MANEEKYPKDVFLESIDRCMANDDFITEFFHRFISSSEEVRKKFKYTDISHLSWMLVRSVRIASGAIDGNPTALNELRQRAESHDRHHLNIEPKLYDLWLEAFVETARQYDPLWTEEIETAWRGILAHFINVMARHY